MNHRQNYRARLPNRLATWLLAAPWLTMAVQASSGPLQIATDDGSHVMVVESSPRGWNGHTGKNMRPERIAEAAEYPAETLTPMDARELGRRRTPVPWYRRNENVQPGSGVLAESVIPNEDARQRIYPSESGFPERAIGQITFSQDGSGFICTGWLISANTVATAAHCLHGGPGSGFSTNVRFFPGRNGSSSPFGSCSARTLFVPQTWRTGGAESDDYGAFKLNCNVGSSTGFFGLMNLTAVNGISVAITGYPGDKPSGTSWSGSGAVVSSTASKVRYRIDTAGGQSGSPIFEPDRVGQVCTGVCALGIHAYGVSGGTNSGTRINSVVLSLLNSARNAP